VAHSKLSFRESFGLLWRGKRAYWALNLANFGDGVAYFGILTLLVPFLTTRLHMSDPLAGLSVSLFTGLVALFMLNGGRIADLMGVRQALTFSLGCSALGRGLLSSSPSLGLGELGNQVAAWMALALMAYGAGVAQTALYIGVKEYTDEHTESLGWDLLYSIMNLGIVGASLTSPLIRNSALHFGQVSIPGLNLGIDGVFWVLTGLTGSLVLANTLFFSSDLELSERNSPLPEGFGRIDQFAKGFGLAILCGLMMSFVIHDTEVHPAFWAQAWKPLAGVLAFWLFSYLRNLNVQFGFFIFILLPVRTLFAHQWLTVPSYIFRCFDQSIHQVMEWVEMVNPIVVSIAVPALAVASRRMKVIDVMILGTGISALITYVLVPAADARLLLLYMVVFSLGEAIWASRFLEYVATLAPPGQTGAYMGVANLPWFLAKFTTGMYSGLMLQKFVPEGGAHNPGMLWLIYACFAMISPLGLMLGRNWILRAEQRQSAHSAVAPPPALGLNPVNPTSSAEEMPSESSCEEVGPTPR